MAVESDPDCRRCLRRRFPGLELCADIKKVTRDQVKQWLRKIPDANGVIVGGGSPCQGLSKLSVDRRHLEDERSALFHEAVRVMKLVKEEASLEGMWCVRFLENVVPDDEDIRIMSRELDLRPLLVDSKHLSRARRPRLFWLSIDLIEHQEAEVHQHELFDEIWYGAATEPMHAVLSEGCRWPPGENDTAARFPTMTRAIPRKKPPKAPAGLDSTSEEGRSRWIRDRYRYPPYTYNSEYMVEEPSGDLRPLNANEREVLMGFQKGHTLDLARKPPENEREAQALEDQRCAAIGNAFHAVAVAALFDHALWSFGVKPLVGHHEIVEARTEEIKREASKAVEPSQEISLDPAPAEGDSGGESDATQVCSWRMESKKIPRSPASCTAIAGVSEADMNMAVQMVQAFVRRQEYRGSDVRLDVNTLYRADAYPRATVNPHRWLWHVAHAYPFEVEERINVLELRALVHTVEWRLRRKNFNGTRFLHLADSQVTLSVAVKGRSSSHKLNRLLRKLAAMCTAAGLYPVLAWIESHLNPADAPSRRYER